MVKKRQDYIKTMFEEWKEGWRLMCFAEEAPTNSELRNDVRLLGVEQKKFLDLTNPVEDLYLQCLKLEKTGSEEEKIARNALVRNSLLLAKTLLTEKPPKEDEINLLKETVTFANKVVSRTEINPAELDNFNKIIPQIKNQCANSSSLKNKLWGGILIAVGFLTTVLTFGAALPLGKKLASTGMNFISPQKYADHLAFHKKVTDALPLNRQGDETAPDAGKGAGKKT